MSRTESDNPTIIEEMERLADRAVVEIIELENKRADIDADIKRLKGMLRAVRPEEAKRKKVGRPKGSINGNGRLSSERLERIKDVATFIRSNYVDGDDFTAIGLHQAMDPGWGQHSTNQALIYLRSIEFIGKTGLETLTRRQQWTKLDGAEQALENAGL